MEKATQEQLWRLGFAILAIILNGLKSIFAEHLVAEDSASSNKAQKVTAR